MKIFVATLATETNTFAPIPTGMASFEELGIRRGTSRTANPASICLMLDAIRAAAQKGGHSIVEGLGAVAQPAGPVTQDAYESLRDELLHDLQTAMPVDAVILILHGAMVASRCDDCEGDVLQRIRKLVGPNVPIGAELDPHCHLSAAMIDNADILASFKEYPHTDTAEVAGDVCRLTIAAVSGEIQPVIGAYDCRMVGLWPTTQSPIADFVARLRSVQQQDGVLSVSFGHGFPWGDVADGGAKIWVVTDNDQALADSTATMLGRELWEIREAGLPSTHSIEDAIQKMSTNDATPLVVADMSDNPGGGAPGDATFLLQPAMQSGLGRLTFGCFWDPGAVQLCFQAGLGASVQLRIGGKAGTASGLPLDVEGTVAALDSEHQQTVYGAQQPFGASARIVLDNDIEIVMTTLRQQVVGTDAFENLGAELRSRRAIVVKSAQHFYAAFKDLAGEVIYVDTAGALSHDFARIPYRKRPLNYWPRVDNPFKDGAA